jgi:cell division protein FtsI/penicillin-binding protein 2/cell division protein FtsW (lipid II flippase)
VTTTYVSASERDGWLAADSARRLDVRHGLLVFTSIVAVLAVLSSYGGRYAADERSAASRQGLPPINLNEVKNASELTPLIERVFTEPGERRAAAAQLYDFISALRAREERLPNVGALLGAKAVGSGEARQVLTREQLTMLKPAVVVRTHAEHLAQLLLWGTVYLVSVWVVALFWWARGVRGDYLLLSVAHLLTVLGFAALVSRQDPLRDTQLFIRFAQVTAAGHVLFACVSVVDFRRVSRLGLTYLPLLGALVLSLLLVVFGSGPAGSSAKVNLGPMQPVEFMRLLLALFLAGYFARRWEVLRGVRGHTVRSVRLPDWLNLPRVDYVLPVMAGVAVALLFFFVQRDLGPALFLSCVFLITYAIARNRVGLALTGFFMLVAGFYVGYALDISSTLTARVAIWQSAWDNSVRGGEQVAQAIWGLSTGGLFGTGLGLGNTAYVPAGFTDLMLAAIGEELGFAGLLAVSFLFVMIAARGFNAALHATSDYAFFLAIVLTLFLTLPVLVMAAGMLGLVPLTGVVTPFLSFGGSAMLANFIALGILTAIRMQSSSAGNVSEPFHAGVRRLVVALGVSAAALVAVLFDVQIVHADTNVVRPHLGIQADGQRRYQYNPRIVDVLTRIPRGTVFDRRGLPLATSDERIAQSADDTYKKAGMTLAACDTPMRERCYPLAGAAFHLLGDARDGRNWSASNTAYIERDAQDHLRGFDDHATSVKTLDPAGRPVAAIRRDYSGLIPLLRHRHNPEHPDVKAFMGRSRDVTLTIDARLQASVADILAKYASRSSTGHAAAVVIDPDTGEVLAVGSYPFPSMEDEHADDEDEDERLMDRARFGLYPPGSTFKLVTASAALRQGLSSKDKTFMCSLQAGGRVGAGVGRWGVIRDDVLDRHPHGTIDMHDGLVHSCNAYFAQLAARVGPESVLETANLLGISVARDDSLARLRATLPFAGYGQGDVVTSPLRMARVAAAIASKGVLRDNRVERTRGTVPESARAPTTSRTLLTPDAAATLARYMRDAVLSGTGRALREHPGRIAGKTGTAEVSGAASHAWFVGYAPYGAAKRRVAFAVIIENAGYGGLAAAPAAGEIVSAAAASGLIE